MIDDCVRCRPRILKLVKGDEKECFESAVLERRVKKLGEAATQFSQMAQRSVQSVVRGRPLPAVELAPRRLRQNSGKTAANDNPV